MKLIRTLLFTCMAAALLTACDDTPTVADHNDTAVAAGEHGETGHHDHGHSEADLPEAGVQAAWTFNRGEEAPTAEAKTMIRIALTMDGQPIESFETTHEEKQHLIIVSADLSYFSHIHPVYQGNGVFEASTVFPSGGRYKLIADFVPQGGSAMHRSAEVDVSGPAAAAAPLEAESEWSRTAEGLNASLSFDAPLSAGKEVTLRYKLTDTKTSAPVTDLQPYLGAIGHVVILSRDAEQYLHVHPADGQGSGPEATFSTVFPQTGMYKIWAQFKRNDRIITIPFVVNVQA